MKILLTGFGLWGSVQKNPSWDMLNNIPSSVGEHTIIKGKITVAYSKIRQEVLNLIDTHNPDVILSFGVSSSIAKPRVEAYGWNYGASGRDNEGVVLNNLLDKNKTARVGYETTYNGDEVERWFSGTKFSIIKSIDAADFLCNAQIYHTLQILDEKSKQTPFMFVHVPFENRMTLRRLEDFTKLLIDKVMGELNQPTNLSGTSGSVESASPRGDSGEDSREDSRGDDSREEDRREEEQEPESVDTQSHLEGTTGESVLTNASDRDYEFTPGRGITYRINTEKMTPGTYRFVAEVESTSDNSVAVMLSSSMSSRETIRVSSGKSVLTKEFTVDRRTLMSYPTLQFTHQGRTKITIKGGTAKLLRVLE